MTCWEFKSKVQQAMCSSKEHPLSGTVHVDEFLIEMTLLQRRYAHNYQ
jgi:hypothetical protein